MQQTTAPSRKLSTDRTSCHSSQGTLPMVAPSSDRQAHEEPFAGTMRPTQCKRPNSAAAKTMGKRQSKSIFIESVRCTTSTTWKFSSSSSVVVSELQDEGGSLNSGYRNQESGVSCAKLCAAPSSHWAWHLLGDSCDRSWASHVDSAIVPASSRGGQTSFLVGPLSQLALASPHAPLLFSFMHSCTVTSLLMKGQEVLASSVFCVPNFQGALKFTVR